MPNLTETNLIICIPTGKENLQTMPVCMNNTKQNTKLHTKSVLFEVCNTIILLIKRKKRKN